MFKNLKMDSSFGQDMNQNIIKLLQNRERNLHTARTLQQRTHFTDNLIKRLSLEHELEGHQGCVNCLEWSSDGRHLASGSDDTNVIIWDPFSHKKLKTINTPHIGNIFSVKFLGSSETMVATGAGDFRVVVQDVNQDPSSVPLLECSCHRGRVKRLARAPDQPLVFWSASEDGLAIQYDMREAHTCSSHCSIFVDLAPTTDLKCIAVNPTQPHYVVLGANDCFVRLYDRRLVKMKQYRFHSVPEPILDQSCVQYYTPGHLAKPGSDQYKVAVTYVSFNSRGSELLVNMGGEQIYLFDVNNPSFASELRIPNATGQRKPQSCSNNLPDSHNVNININQSGKSSPINGNNQISACQIYLNRAGLLLKRKWIGDCYSAARDYLYVIRSWPHLAEAYLGLIDCLISLTWKTEAVEWLSYFLQMHPEYKEQQVIEMKRKDIQKITRLSEVVQVDELDMITERELRLREKSIDFDARFLGHCNTTTDIKEANFVGENGQYVMAGSDDGIIFIWDRYTTNIVTALWGDVSIVNCVQPHPNACLIATSGIDPVVKLWSPSKEDGSENLRQVKNLDAAVEANQKRMAMDPFETLLANMGYRLRDSAIEASLNEIPTCRTS